ncbi:MAG: hypothetical protein PHE03_10150 [Bacteroidales bacterium]|nr:hypothetical protein [Bacteroidales bacterium]
MKKRKGKSRKRKKRFRVFHELIPLLMVVKLLFETINSTGFMK